jgi:CHAD domain-containing protein
VPRAQKREAKVRRHGRSLKRLDDTQLHALRISIKKLRYATDCFGSLFDRDAVRHMLERLADLQDVLGEINDLHVADRQVAAALAGRRGHAVTGLRAALARRRDMQKAKLRCQLRTAWRGYRHAIQ